MKTVLHTCPFVPPEWVAAHGLSPMRITPAAAVPRPGLTAGVCPFAGAFMAAACATGVEWQWPLPTASRAPAPAPD